MAKLQSAWYAKFGPNTASPDDHTRVSEVSCDQFGSQLTTMLWLKKKITSVYPNNLTSDVEVDH